MVVKGHTIEQTVDTPFMEHKPHFSHERLFSNKATALILTIFFLYLIPFTETRAQTYVKDSVHEMTVFFMPTAYPINWESPASLFQTTKKNFIKSIIHKDTYIIGHAAICLKTPLLPQGVRYIAMTAAEKRERVELVLKQKIGLAILGATLKGRLEDESHIMHRLSVYARHHKLAYITFRVNEACMARMLTFIQEFSQQRPEGIYPCDYYGGAYWPLYADEGAGCTAFALGVLASAGLLPPEAGKWLVKVNIPMNLIGGEFNGGKKVPFSHLLKAKEWYCQDGIPNVDYIIYQIYDPSIAYDWILHKRMNPDNTFEPVSEGGALGLMVDFRDKACTTQGAIFSKRPDRNRFIDIYYLKAQSNISGSANK